MRRPSRAYPSAIAGGALAAGLAAFAPACTPRHVITPMPIDLLRELPNAALAPAADAAERIDLRMIDTDTGAAPALVMQPTSRVIWQVQMTERAELRARLARLPGGDPAAALSVRLGVSDERLYEDHLRTSIAAPAGEAAEWRAITIDLSLYSGPKWSVFYRPAHRAWSLVLNVQGDPGASLALVGPVITAPSNTPDRPAR